MSPAKKHRRRRGGWPRVWLLAFGLAAGLLFAEAAVRATNVDGRFLRKIAFYQPTDLASHEAVRDLEIHYRPKPGTVDYGGYRVTINSLGFRSPERPAAKPPGVYRILCVGGSNVYGVDLNDDETWPAQLETKLNQLPGGGCYEVWNLGVPAHGGRQHAALAAEAIARIHPDVTIIGLSNFGLNPFLQGGPVEWYFDHDPKLWRNIVAEAGFPLPPWLAGETEAWLAHRVRFFRLALLAWIAKTAARPQEVGGKQCEVQNVAAVRRLVSDPKARTRFAFFLCPNPICQQPGQHNRRYTASLAAPVMSLAAPDQPAEYRELHPPAYVMTWYADNIADWLRRQGLAPPCASPPVLAPATGLR